MQAAEVARVQSPSKLDLGVTQHLVNSLAPTCTRVSNSHLWNLSMLRRTSPQITPTTTPVC